MELEQGNCIGINIALLLALQYKVVAEVALSEGRKQQNNEYSSIVNDNEVTVGQLIGDGISVQLSSTIRQFSICLDPRNDIPQDTETFTEFDFAIAYPPFNKVKYILLFIIIFLFLYLFLQFISLFFYY